MKKEFCSIGTLWKREKLTSFEWDLPFEEFVLEDICPLPGYYDHFEIPSGRQNMLPSWVFAVLRTGEMCDNDNIIRVTQDIKKSFPVPFDAAEGRILLNNESLPSIRFQLGELGYLPGLLKAYKNRGVLFAANRKIGPVDSLISVVKYFDLELLDEYIYKDNDLRDVYYLELPHKLSWEDFEAVTQSVKNNSEFKVFDAALATLYNKRGVVDLVRIFIGNANQGVLPELCSRYRREAARVS